MTDRLNKTSICSIVFLDIIDYSRKSVSEQFDDKSLFNDLINEAIKNVAQNDRIILDTGDGAAITLMGEPEEALFVALTIRDGILEHNKTAEIPLLVRIGINLGSVRVVKDINDRPNIIGDGINVAQRIMSFAGENQILVSRSYYEVTARLTKEITGMFVYSGIKQDKHVREHEVYSIKPTAGPEPEQTEDAITAAQFVAGKVAKPQAVSSPLLPQIAVYFSKVVALSNAWFAGSINLFKRLLGCLTGIALSASQQFKTILAQPKQRNVLLIIVGLLLLLLVWFLLKPAQNEAPTAVTLPPATTQAVDAMPALSKPDTPAKPNASDVREQAPKSQPVEAPTAEKANIKKPVEKAIEKPVVKAVEKPTQSVVEKPVKKSKPKASSSKRKEVEQVKAVEHAPQPIAPPACSQAEIAMNQCRR